MSANTEPSTAAAARRTHDVEHGADFARDVPPRDAGDANFAATGSLHEIEPPGQRTAWGRWFDRFVGPKRHPLPLTKTAPERTPEILPTFADSDPFGEI